MEPARSDSQWTFGCATAAYHVIAPTRGKCVPTDFLAGVRPKVWLSDRLPAQCTHGEAAVVTLGAALQRHAGDLFVPVTVVFFDFKVGSGRRDLQKLPAQCELLCPVSIGEEAVVANTLKSFGQNVEQEPTRASCRSG